MLGDEEKEGETGGADAEGGAGDADRLGDGEREWDGLPDELPLGAGDVVGDCEADDVGAEDPLDVALVVMLTDGKALAS